MVAANLKTLTDVLAENGMGAIGFTALAQGLLTDKYLRAPPARTGPRLDRRSTLRFLTRRRWLAYEA